jgi:protein-tyrosine phosphatase
VKLDQFRRLSTVELIESLRLGMPGALKARPGRIVEMGAKVFWITGPWQGRLGIVPRPRGAEWLDDETRAWREADIDVVVSLLEPGEEAELALAGESASSAASGLDFRSFPIPDRSVPSSRETVAQLVDQIVNALHAGKSVALHCRQGIGRSVLIAAAILISGGQNAETAIKTIRRSRGLEVPETHAQRQWISDFSSWLADKRAAQPRHATDGAPRRS